MASVRCHGSLSYVFKALGNTCGAIFCLICCYLFDFQIFDFILQVFELFSSPRGISFGKALNLLSRFMTGVPAEVNSEYGCESKCFGYSIEPCRDLVIRYWSKSLIV